MGVEWTVGISKVNPPNIDIIFRDIESGNAFGTNMDVAGAKKFYEGLGQTLEIAQSLADAGGGLSKKGD